MTSNVSLILLAQSLSGGVVRSMNGSPRISVSLIDDVTYDNVSGIIFIGMSRGKRRSSIPSTRESLSLSGASMI